MYFSLNGILEFYIVKFEYRKLLVTEKEQVIYVNC